MATKKGNSNNLQNVLIARRFLLSRLISFGSLPFLLPSVPTVAHADQASGEPTNPSWQTFMDQAFVMKERAVDSGDQPYGAIVVKGDEIVGEGPSRVIVDQDPTAHAEMVAIRDAASRLGSRDLSGCVMFSTSRPCRMCETASYWAGIDQFYYSASMVDGGSPQYSSCS